MTDEAKKGAFEWIKQHIATIILIGSIVKLTYTISVSSYNVSLGWQNVQDNTMTTKGDVIQMKSDLVQFISFTHEHADSMGNYSTYKIYYDKHHFQYAY